MKLKYKTEPALNLWHEHIPSYNKVPLVPQHTTSSILLKPYQYWKMSSWTDRVVTNNHILPYVDSSTATPEVAKALKTLPFERNIFKLIANADSLFVPFMGLLSSCWAPGRALRGTEWQLTVLRTAWLMDAPYEWDVNEPAARVFGLDDDMFKDIRGKDRKPQGELTHPRFTARHKIVYTMVNELVAHDKVLPETMTKAKQIMGDKATTEVIIIHGVYALVAKTIRSAQVDFDPEIPGLLDALRELTATAIKEEQEAEAADRAQALENAERHV